MASSVGNSLLTEAVFFQDLPPPIRQVGFNEEAEVKVVWMQEGTQENLPESVITATALGDIRTYLEEIQAADPDRRYSRPQRRQPSVPQEMKEVSAIRRMAQWDDALDKFVYKPLSEGDLKRINIRKMKANRDRLNLKNKYIYRTNVVYYETIQQYLGIYDILIAEAKVMQGLD